MSIFYQAVDDVIKMSDDLRKSRWRGDPNPYAGHCYVVSESVYHMIGKVWIPASLRIDDEIVHWFLRDRLDQAHVLDLTAKQFSEPPDYSCGRNRGFLTKKPSARSKMMMSRIAERERQLYLERRIRNLMSKATHPKK